MQIAVHFIEYFCQTFPSKKMDLKSCYMKTISLFIALFISGFWCLPAISQADSDTTSLGLPGDNLDLYAVLELFQKSKTIEEFEKTLNTEKTGVNNLDLNLDKKVDFIKVETKQNDKDFTFILQVDVTEKEKQDVAVILVSKDKNDKVTMQIVGDKDLYGKDYIIEPKPATPVVTANPGYSGADPVTTSVPTTTAAAVTTAQTPTTVVVVESAPIVQYVYSPVYVPYYPPVYPPPYYTAFAVVAVSVYHHNNYYYHSGYHGGYNNTTVVVHNTNNYNNYNKSRNSSNTVNHNNANNNYNGNSGNKASTNNANTNNKTGNNSANAKNKTGNNSANASSKTNNNSANTSNKASNNSVNSSNTGGNKTSASPSTKPTNSSASPSKSSKSSGSSHPSTGSSGRSGRSGGGRSGGRR